ncbi:MAG: hypothetical protein KAS94_05545 [Desulfobulbaceae bacterium]|nr:hypothetical protein [Desulfobulbaceae bacterium]
MLITQGEGVEETDLTLLGLIAIMDLPRNEIYEAIATCRAACMTMIIPGDNPRTAAAIAHQNGMTYDRVLTDPNWQASVIRNWKRS